MITSQFVTSLYNLIPQVSSLFPPTVFPLMYVPNFFCHQREQQQIKLYNSKLFNHQMRRTFWTMSCPYYSRFSSILWPSASSWFYIPSVFNRESNNHWSSSLVSNRGSICTHSSSTPISVLYSRSTSWSIVSSCLWCYSHTAPCLARIHPNCLP